MGWVSADGEHEGWAACRTRREVVPSASSSGEGMLFRGLSGHASVTR